MVKLKISFRINVFQVVMNSRIIRKLGKKESLKLNVERGRRFSRSLRVQTCFDLFSRPSVLRKAFRLWMGIHPLLRANIVDVGGEKYFAFDERFLERDGSPCNLDNVNLLVTDSSKLDRLPDKDGFWNDVAWLLCERELDLDTDYSKQLLWRMTILRIPTDQPHEQEYEMILVLNHTISEGRNSHMLLLQLLDLIEYTWDRSKEMTAPLKEDRVLPSIEQLYYDNFDQAKHSNERVRSLPSVVKANYIDQAEAARSQMKPYDWASDMANEWVYSLASECPTAKIPFIQFDRLVQESKSIFYKSKRFTLSQRYTDKLIQKCKEKKCTVNFALVNLLSFSLRKLEYSISADGSLPHQVNVIIPTTLRQFEPTCDGFEATPDFSCQLMMGYYISATTMSLSRLASISVDKLDSPEEFWECCKNDTDQFRDIIKGKEVLFPSLNRNRKADEAEATFVVSNLGQLPNILPCRNALSAQVKFRIKQAYTEACIKVKDFWKVGPLILFASTCDSHLNLSFMNNSFVMSHENADRVAEFFFELLRKILDFLSI